MINLLRRLAALSTLVSLGHSLAVGQAIPFEPNTVVFSHSSDGVGCRCAGPQWKDMFLADMDGDGDLDAIVVNQGDTASWHMNSDGEGNFTTIRGLTTNSDHRSLTAGDIDGDGIDDVLLAGDELNLLEARRSAASDHAPRVIHMGGTSQAELIHFDGNGFPDVLVAADDATLVLVSFGTADFTYVEQPVSGPSLAAHAADLDRDGDTDVVTGESGMVVWNENLGGGQGFMPHIVHPGTATAVHTIDVDSDGDLDILSNAGEQFSWHENMGGTPPAWKLRVFSANGPKRIATADVDRDGDSDIVQSPGPAWFMQSESSPQPWTRRSIAGSTYPALTWGDVNTDGFLDFGVVAFSSTQHGLPVGGCASCTSLSAVSWYANGSRLTPRAIQIIDASGDGLISPGEGGLLAFQLENRAVIAQPNATAIAESLSPNLTVLDPPINVGMLAAGSSTEVAFAFTTDPMAGCGSTAQIRLKTAWDGGDSHFPPVDVRFGEFVEETATVAETPNMVIPDNDLTGVTRTLNVLAPGGAIREVRVSADITHPFRGDLMVTFTGPGDNSFTLFSAPGDPNADLHLFERFTYQFDGLPATGDYTLHVRDTGATDVGVLSSWSVEVDYAGYQCDAFTPAQVVDQLLGRTVPGGVNDFDLNDDGRIDAADVVRVLAP